MEKEKEYVFNIDNNTVKRTKNNFFYSVLVFSSNLPWTTTGFSKVNPFVFYVCLKKLQVMK